MLVCIVLVVVFLQLIAADTAVLLVLGVHCCSLSAALLGATDTIQLLDQSMNL